VSGAVGVAFVDIHYRFEFIVDVLSFRRAEPGQLFRHFVPVQRVEQLVGEKPGQIYLMGQKNRDRFI